MRIPSPCTPFATEDTEGYRGHRGRAGEPMARPYKACPVMLSCVRFFYPSPRPCSPLNPPAQRGAEFRIIGEGELKSAELVLH